MAGECVLVGKRSVCHANRWTEEKKEEAIGNSRAPSQKKKRPVFID
jgi:hypothetical protein